MGTESKAAETLNRSPVSVSATLDIALANDDCKSEVTARGRWRCLLTARA